MNAKYSAMRKPMTMLALMAVLVSQRTTCAFTTAPSVGISRSLLAPKTRNPTLRYSPVQLRMTDNEDLEPTEKPALQRKSPDPVALSSIKESIGNPNAAVAASVLAGMLMLSPLSASAAMSGGRMGGSFGSSGGGGSYSRSVPSYSRGYSQGYRSGYGSGYYSRPSVAITPFYNPFYSPFYSPYGAGVGVVSPGFSLFPLLAFGFGAWVLLNVVPAVLSQGMESTSLSWSDDSSSVLGSGTSVVEMSVALEVPNRDDRNSILTVLNRLSQTARTDSRVGIQNLTSQVALELLRRKSSIVSASTRSKHFNNRQKAERDFNQLSVKERSKFEQETVSKYGGVDFSQGQGRTSSVDGKATMAVVTIILAIDGDSTKLSRISSIGDVEEALRRIASDAKTEDCLQSAEILWTPEDRSETLTLRDVVADYPELRSV